MSAAFEFDPFLQVLDDALLERLAEHEVEELLHRRFRYFVEQGLDGPNALKQAVGLPVPPAMLPAASAD